jgi:hypothetical protein
MFLNQQYRYMQPNNTTIKTHTKAGMPVARLTLRITCHTWAIKEKISPIQTIRGDFRFPQSPENIPNMLQDLINYLEDHVGEIYEATLYDNRIPWPHKELLKTRGNSIRVNNLPEHIKYFTERVLQLIRNQPAVSNPKASTK